jgi:hypothetical protein
MNTDKPTVDAELERSSLMLVTMYASALGCKSFFSKRRMVHLNEAAARPRSDRCIFLDEGGNYSTVAFGSKSRCLHFSIGQSLFVRHCLFVGNALVRLSRNFGRDSVPQDDGRLFGEVVLITENAE